MKGPYASIVVDNDGFFLVLVVGVLGRGSGVTGIESGRSVWGHVRQHRPATSFDQYQSPKHSAEQATSTNEGIKSLLPLSYAMSARLERFGSSVRALALLSSCSFPHLWVRRLRLLFELGFPFIGSPCRLMWPTALRHRYLMRKPMGNSSMSVMPIISVTVGSFPCWALSHDGGFNCRHYSDARG